LTPERARKGRRAVRRAVVLAVVHMWAIVAIVALLDLDLLWLFLALAVLYSVSAPSHHSSSGTSNGISTAAWFPTAPRRGWRASRETGLASGAREP